MAMAVLHGTDDLLKESPRLRLGHAPSIHDILEKLSPGILGSEFAKIASVMLSCRPV